MPRREADEPRVNEQIEGQRVLLVDEEGNRLGQFLTKDAIQFARDRSLDLVEVAPNAKPPVAKCADYGKLRYEMSKKQSAARKNQTSTQLKELKLRPKTDDHDMDVKIRRAQKFLGDGNRVKVRVWFRGREHAHHDIGAEQCAKLAEAVGDVGHVESPPQMEGRHMIMVLAPDNGATAK